MSGSTSSFPTELVRKIVLSCLLDPEFYTNPFDLASVCHQWRGVIIAEKSLWETLHITWIAGPAVHHYLLQPCMRIAPFGVRAQDMGTPQDFLNRAQDWLARSRNADAKLSLSLETDGTEPRNLLPTLFTQYRHRLCRLSLTASMSTVVRLLRCIHNLNVPAESLLPHLEVFEIYVAYPSPRGTTLRGLAHFDFRKWKALKSLKVRGSKPRGNRYGLLNCRIVNGIPFTQLVYLYLEDRTLTLSGARGILEKCGSLEEFSAFVEQETDAELLPFHETTLPNLRVMALSFLPKSDYACGFVARLFSGLSTPALKELSVDAQYAIDESTRLVSILSHMLQSRNDPHQLEAVTLIVDLSVDPVISMLRDFTNLRYLRLCAPVRGAPAETYLKCGYFQLLEIMTQAQSEHYFPLLEEIFIEDNVPSEIYGLSSLFLEDGKMNPDIACHLGLFVIQSLVESRCRPENHIRCVSVIWKNAGHDWSSLDLDTGKNNCPYNCPALKVRENSVEIIAKCLPHCQRTPENS
ncbi:hypothetical protein H2248_005337 [Termitomyces sp. 'cryptogamus']|nr:hypothetical protein H2248_005337 [Termitomyces sp. 'cryptogamus']